MQEKLFRRLFLGIAILHTTSVLSSAVYQSDREYLLTALEDSRNTPPVQDDTTLWENFIQDPNEFSENRRVKPSRLPDKNITPREKLAALRLVYGLLGRMLTNGTEPLKSRTGRNLFQGRKIVRKLLSSAIAGNPPSTSEVSPEEVAQFLADVSQLSTLFNEGQLTEPDPAINGFDIRDLLDILSGARFSELLEQWRGSLSALISTNPLTDIIQPLVDLFENNQIADLLDTSAITTYITGEAEENNAITQLASVLSPRDHEFPLSCNTSRQFTEIFKTGVCIRLADCFLYNGESFGTCGIGTGACCVFHQTCDATSSEWISHFTHPDTRPTPGYGSCRYTVEPRHGNVCQYRLDFEQFKISGPNVESVCEFDFVEVFGGSKVPRLCGDLTGQHMYVNALPGEYIQIAVYTSNQISLTRTWNIKVTQINCDAEERAPGGCLQFFNSTEGRVKSFNHKKANSARTSDMYQIADTNYGVCVNPTPNHCAILWQEAGEFGFSLSGDAFRNSHQLITGLQNCLTDYIIIPGAVFRSLDTGNLEEDTRFCGTKLPKIITNRLPYIIRVVSDKTEIVDRGNAGFDLYFKQIPCVGET